jgi:hypothetical protein
MIHQKEILDHYEELRFKLEKISNKCSGKNRVVRTKY